MTLVRYVLRTLLAHMLAVLGVLAGLLWVFNFLDQMEDVGSGSYTVGAAGIYALSMVPSWIAEFAPMAAFLGALTGIGRLQQDSEITAMRAAGWSITRLGTVAAIGGTAFAIAGFLVGEVIAPRLMMAAVQRKAELRFGPELSASSAGIWTRDDLRIIGFDRRHARSVTVLTLDEEGQLVAWADARTVRHAGSFAIAFDDYNESRIRPAGIARIHEASRIERGPGVAALLSLSNDAMRAPSIRQLYSRIRELRAAGLDHADLVYELHDRIARVFVAPLLVILAVISVVGPLRSSRRGSRLLMGIVTGFGLSMLREAANGVVTVFGLSPVAMAWVPVIVLLAAVVLLARILRPRQRVLRSGSVAMAA